MIEALDCLRQMNTPSVLLRLTLAMFCGGMIGLDRARKRRPAGLRTYMLVCVGAALTMLLSQYEAFMLSHAWAPEAAEIGIRTDVSRFGAQVINGIGFLGAGTILVTGQQKVKGLTTAAGLWATACMGLAIGAGFYEGVVLSFVCIFLSIKVLPYVEFFLLSRSRNMNLYVELVSLERLRGFIALTKAIGIQIFDVELDRRRAAGGVGVVLYLRLPKNQSHTKLLTDLSYSPDVRAIDEI